MSNTLRQKINTSGVLNLDDQTFIEKFRNFLNLRNYGVNSREAALAAVKDEKRIQGVLWGRLDRFESSGSKVCIKGEWELVNVANGKVVCSNKIDIDTINHPASSLNIFTAPANNTANSNAAVPAAGGSIPWWLRICGFAVTVLLLPLVTFGVIRAIVVKRSNGINAAVLAVYTVIDAILATMMIGGNFGSNILVVVFTLAVILSLLYNSMMMSFALKLETE